MLDSVTTEESRPTQDQTKRLVNQTGPEWLRQFFSRDSLKLCTQRLIQWKSVDNKRKIYLHQSLQEIILSAVFG